MDKSFENVDPELVRMLDSDLNLVTVFQYIENTNKESRKRAKGLYYNGRYYVPNIMYRFQKALRFYSKYDIEKHLKRLIKSGFVLKEKFYAQPNHTRKTTGYRINEVLLNWEKQFIPLKELSDKTLNEENGKEIRDLVNNFMFKVRSAYNQ